MARVLSEHLESGNFTKDRLLLNQGCDVVNALSGDNSRRYLSMNNAFFDTYCRLHMHATYSEVYGEVWDYTLTPASLNTEQLLRLFSGNIQLAAFQIDDHHLWHPKIGGTVQAAGTEYMTWGIWHCFEFYYKIHATTGALQLWMDGVEMCNYVGNTVVSGQTSFDIYEMYHYATSTGRQDGLKIQDTTGSYQNGRTNIIYAVSQDPDTDSFYNDFDQSAAGAKHNLVDEYPVDYNDFVFTLLNAKRQGWGFGPHGLPADSEIIAVIHEAWARKISEGQLKQNQRLLDGNVDTANGPTDLGVDHKIEQNYAHLDPSGNLWTVVHADNVDAWYESVI